MPSESEFPDDAGKQLVKSAEDYLKSLGKSGSSASNEGQKTVSAAPEAVLVSPPEEYGGEELQERARNLLETEGMDGIRRFLVERGLDSQFVNQRISEERNEFGSPTDNMTVEAYLNLRIKDLSEQAARATQSTPQTNTRIGIGIAGDLHSEIERVKALNEVWKNGNAVESVLTYIERGKPEALVQAAVQMEVLHESSADHPTRKGAAGSLIGVGARYIGAHRLAQQVQARIASMPPT